MTEQWRAVSGLDGFYEVSDLGRLRSVTRIVDSGHDGRRLVKGRVLRLDMSTRYARAMVSAFGVHRVLTVHLEVMALFGPPPKLGEEVRHLSGDRTDNSLANLAWGTKRENAEDKKLHGTYLVGETIPNSRLKVADIHEILKLEGALPLRGIAEIVNCGLSTVHHVLTGRTWGHVTGRRHHASRREERGGDVF